MESLEKIKATWAMGWSATVKSGEHIGQIVSLLENYNAPNHTCAEVRFGDGSHVNFHPEYELKAFEVVGYKYAGELAGNKPIPKSQKFRFKDNPGHIVDGWYGSKKETCILNDYDKSEIEPYFN